MMLVESANVLVINTDSVVIQGVLTLMMSLTRTICMLVIIVAEVSLLMLVPLQISRLVSSLQ